MPQLKQKKQANPLKSPLISLVAVGFFAGLFLLSGIWMMNIDLGMAGTLFSVILIFVSITCLLIAVRIYAHISLNLAQTDQKHLQNALIQAKDMLDTSKQLRDDHVLLQSLMQNLPFPIWLKDRFGRYLVSNQVFVQQWCNGVDPKGQTDTDLLNEKLAEAFAAADHQALSTGVPQKLDLRMDLPNQPAKWVRIERYALIGEDNQAVGVLGFAFDTSSFKNGPMIETDSLRDGLTHFANQAGLARYIEQHTELSSSVWCVHIDIDHFKVVNDSMGHDSGDKLLQQIAERISRVSETGDYLARPNADEFVLFWFDQEEDQRERRLKNLHDQLNQPMTLGDSQLSFTTSIGAAKSPEHGASCKDLLHHADVALFNAKKLGRNQIHWYQSSYQGQALRRLNKEQSLRQAISNEDLIIHAQPRIDCRSGVIEAIELLVRIPAAEGDLLYPGKFISLAEQTGLIRDLDKFMITRAIEQLLRWFDEGIEPLPIAVNLSLQSFNEQLIAQLAVHQNDSNDLLKYLELEITEHRLPENDDDFLLTLHQLRDMGIRLALDDFGTGYANMSRLPDWPFQILKLDRSFILDLPDSEKQQAVVQSIVELCSTLKIEVVAEGIETEQELAVINKLGCHSIQGYLYAQPKPLESCTDWLEQRKISAQ